MKQSTTIIKFGGSILTDKSKTSTLNPKFSVKSVADKLVDYTKHSQPLVLIHGAGSFGHPQASEHGLLSVTKYWDSIENLNYSDLLNSNESIKDFSEFPLSSHYTEQDLERFKIGGKLTKEAVTELHNYFKQQLVSIGLPIVSVYPSEYLTSYSEVIDGKSVTIQLKGVQKLLKHITTLINSNQVPLLHGDVLKDNLNESKIISGDLIAYLLCCHLNEHNRTVESIYLTDVDGVFDKDPKRFNDAKLIELIEINKDSNNLNAFEQKDEVTTGGSVKDITGSMLGKLKWAIESIKDCGESCHARVINYEKFILKDNTVETLLKFHQ
ncbi:carbamate kinase-like protein [Conidiobolus coronatus NRRL 28638]|uniref:Carbamate kinase-like protein n=1 Tax=Conidiobolus coronatus (strain ATCC 28846 / CBS 209.66 / NRRL 28638) TaxID=796925 RepID=A0A137PA89_CONC2|nr:carbamate kinase-like protein [Conidiobolus coronatus NRRL 28638]|eukprot:KXN71927.1 carbamate kinase-like protein [Conidiobolus coronatus NRRL 28638]